MLVYSMTMWVIGKAVLVRFFLLTVVWAMLEPFQCDCRLTEVWVMGKAFSV